MKALAIAYVVLFFLNLILVPREMDRIARGK